MNIDPRRLSILSAREVDELYGLPRFTEVERRLYFDLSAAEREAVAEVGTVSVAVYLTLQLGYFKAKQQFFDYEQEAVVEDLCHVLKEHFPGRDLSSIKTPSRPTRREQRRIILKLFDYRLCDNEAKAELELKALRIARRSTQPLYILRETLQNLASQRIVAPGYRFLQEMVGRVVASESKRVTQLLGQALTPTVREQLDALLKADEGMYRISALKHEPKDFSHKELRQEVERRKCFQPLHAFAHALPADPPFYSQLPGIGVADLLWFVAAKTGFMGAFTHVLDRYVKHEPNPREILACIVAMGTNMGLWKMADVSGLGHPSLMSTARNYLRLETLHAANDAISNAIAALPVFHLYDIQGEMHSSSDGQRFETQIDTINARHASKYFGLKKGVSAYTLVANHVPINARVIGTHEHESHYVFDLLYNNTSDIKPERHSTDTHGTNQVNFWILHAFGYQFAPRYRDLHKKTDALVGPRHPGHYGDFLIKPSRQTYGELIEKEWPNIQRIMASLAQKDVTQATIVRKLASYARQNQTKKALWGLENICRTLYILDFIDDVELRRGVQKALNRGEAYHRFRRAVAYVNGGKFRVQTEAEQQIWNECSRLIANAVIYYNTVLLSRVYEQKQAAGDQAAMAAIRGMSPVAWRHVNLIGKFEFSTSEPKVDIDALVARYADPAFWSKALKKETGGDLS